MAFLNIRQWAYCKIRVVVVSFYIPGFVIHIGDELINRLSTVIHRKFTMNMHIILLTPLKSFTTKDFSEKNSVDKIKTPKFGQ